MTFFDRPRSRDWTIWTGFTISFTPVLAFFLFIDHSAVVIGELTTQGAIVGFLFAATLAAIRYPIRRWG